MLDENFILVTSAIFLIAVVPASGSLSITPYLAESHALNSLIHLSIHPLVLDGLETQW